MKLSISTLVSQRIKATHKEGNIELPLPDIKAANEMNTNADTFCLGNKFTIISYTSRTADVYPYDSSYSPIQNVLFFTGATAWSESTGATFILIIHEALYYGMKLDHSLINPNQICANGIDVHDDPFTTQQISIHIDEGLNTSATIIPMSQYGPKIYFNRRTPTEEELNTCYHIELTSSNEWNPDSVVLDEIDLVSRTLNIERHIQSHSTLIDPNNPYSHAIESKYYYYEYQSDDTILLDMDPNCIMMKE